MAHVCLRWRIHTVTPTVMLIAITSAKASGARSLTWSTLVPAAVRIPPSTKKKNIIPTKMAATSRPGGGRNSQARPGTYASADRRQVWGAVRGASAIAAHGLLMSPSDRGSGPQLPVWWGARGHETTPSFTSLAGSSRLRYQLSRVSSGVVNVPKNEPPRAHVVDYGSCRLAKAVLI